MSKTLQTLLSIFFIVAIIGLMVSALIHRPESLSAILAPQSSSLPSYKLETTDSPLPINAVTGRIPLGWRTFNSAHSGLSFAHPVDYAVNPAEGKEISLRYSYAFILRTNPIAELPETDSLGYSRAIAQSDQDLLTKGSYGAKIDSSSTDQAGEMNRVVDLGPVNGKVYTVLTRGETCDTRLERHLLFYWKSRQIHLVSRVNTATITDSARAYLKSDPAQCEGNRFWSASGSQALLNDLIEGTAPQNLQTWFSNFDKSVATILLADGEAIAPRITTDKVLATIAATPSLFKDGRDKLIAYGAEKIVFGDLNLDGNPDAVAIAAHIIGKEDIRYHLALFMNQQGVAQSYTQTADIGAGRIIEGVTIKDAILTMATREIDGSRLEQRYRLVDRQLVAQ